MVIFPEGFKGRWFKDYLNMFGNNAALWTWLLLWICLMRDTYPLKDVKAIVPHAAKIHDTVTLQCKYDLEGEPLYTVKWYKGMMEFFRYIPKEDPSMQIFHIPGVQVDLSRSSLNEVVLMDVQPEITGRYKCEVSTDAPNFYTILSSGYMYVIDVPEGDPIMEISKNSIGISHVIKANCTTPPSYPSMNVTWYINGIKVNESGRRSVSLDPVLAYSKSRRTPFMTISHMETYIDDNMYQGGVIRVQCVSSLFDIYKSENVRYIDDNRPQPWPSSVIGFTENGADSKKHSFRTTVVIFLGTILCHRVNTLWYASSSFPPMN